MATWADCANFLKEVERTSWEFRRLRKDQVVDYLTEKLIKASKLLGESKGEEILGQSTLFTEDMKRKKKKKSLSVVSDSALALDRDWEEMRKAGKRIQGSLNARLH